MVSLRGARGSLEWKGKRLKYVPNESVRAGPAWRVLRQKDPRLCGSAQPAASLDAWPAEASRGWPAQPFLAYYPTLDQSLRVLPALFCPLTQPRKGLCAARNRAPHGGPVGKSLLWVNRLFAGVSSRPGPVGDWPT